jgi:hypothetical protein
MVDFECAHAAWQFRIKILFPTAKPSLRVSYEAEEDAHFDHINMITMQWASVFNSVICEWLQVNSQV